MPGPFKAAEVTSDRGGAPISPGEGGDLPDGPASDNATRFIQMVANQGGLATARQLLWSDQVSDGFETLRRHGRLDLSVEAYVLKKEFADLFTDEDRQGARDRLAMFG